MFPLEVDGEVWNYAFIQPDACLSWTDREHLLAETIRLNRDGGKTRKVEGEAFEGRIKAGKYGVIGPFAGRCYDVEIETDKGKRRPSILVIQRDRGLN